MSQSATPPSSGPGLLSIVVYLLKTQWSLSTSQISLLNSITLLTITLLPGPKGKSLEELTEDAYAPPAVRRQEAPA